MTELTVAVLGLGEAGSRLAADLVAAGVHVRGYDPLASADVRVSAAPFAQLAPITGIRERFGGTKRGIFEPICK